MAHQRIAVTFRASPEVLKAIDDYAAKEFCKRGEATAALMESAVANSANFTPSKSADLKEKSAEADLAMKRIRLQQIRKELLPVELAVKTVEDFLGGLRVNGLDFVEEIARDLGLDAKELRRRFLAKMAGDFEVTEERRERLQELANDFSKEPLP